jgi:hypothetical protein
MPLREKRYFKEIGWLLLIKLCLIVAIRIIFFSQPEGRPDGIAATSAHLLGVTPTPETHPQSSENRSSHDQ